MSIRSYHTLRVLAGSFDVTMLCFYRTSDRTTAEEVRRGVEGLSAHARVEVFPIPQEHSRVRLIASTCLAPWRLR